MNSAALTILAITTVVIALVLFAVVDLAKLYGDYRITAGRQGGNNEISSSQLR